MNIQKYTLPSNGMLGYKKDITIRAMKGRELATAYSSLSEASLDAIITAIIEPKISVDLLCDEDKVFILHMARIQTFGDTIKQTLRCPFCGAIHEYEVSYEDFEVRKLESMEEVEGEYTLPNGDVIKKRIPTAEIFEDLNIYRDKNKLELVDNYLLNIVARVDNIKTDERKLTTTTELINYLSDLDGRDFVKVADFLVTTFGLDTTYTVECNNCQTALSGGLGITADLFR